MKTDIKKVDYLKKILAEAKKEHEENWRVARACPMRRKVDL